MDDVFNSREIATACWLGAGLIWMVFKSPARKALWGVLRTFFCRQILVPVCIMALWCGISVWLLAGVGLWKAALLKDTIMWFCAGALAMAMRLATSKEEDVFRKVVADNFRIVILLEFLLNTYTFSLPVELILMPLIALVAMIGEYASWHAEHAPVAKLMQIVQALFGFAILAYAAARAISDLGSLASLDTFRSVALAPLLSALFIPFLYVFLVAVKYQEVFVRLEIGAEKDPSVKRYARRRILAYVRLSMKMLHLLLRDHAGDLVRSRTEDDVDRMLAEMTDALRQ
jgi:hypothetical protein